MTGWWFCKHFPFFLSFLTVFLLCVAHLTSISGRMKVGNPHQWNRSPHLWFISYCANMTWFLPMSVYICRRRHICIGSQMFVVIWTQIDFLQFGKQVFQHWHHQIRHSLSRRVFKRLCHSGTCGNTFENLFAVNKAVRINSITCKETKSTGFPGIVKDWLQSK